MTPEMTEVAERLLRIFKADVYQALEGDGAVECRNDFDEEGKISGRTLIIRYKRSNP